MTPRLPLDGLARDTTRRIGLLGGSFNPAHAGHRHISLEALKRLGLDEVRWLVSPQNPLKAAADIAPLAERVARAAIVARHPRIHVGSPELATGTRFTIDTVTRLQDLYPRARFVWLMGADILPELVRWRDWRGLFRRVPLAIFARPGFGARDLAQPAPRAFAAARIEPERAKTLATCEPPAWCFIPSRLEASSATAIRARRPRPKGKTIARTPIAAPDASLLALVRHSLDEDKAEQVAVLDLKGKSSFADFMVVASGRSTRQVVAIAEKLADRLKQAGHGPIPVEGKETGDWVLVDAGAVVVHVFRPEVREHYAIEKMWSFEAEMPRPPRPKGDEPRPPRPRGDEPRPPRPKGGPPKPRRPRKPA